MTPEEAIARAFVSISGKDPDAPMEYLVGNDWRTKPAWEFAGMQPALLIKTAIEAAGYRIVKDGPNPHWDAPNPRNGSYKP